MKLNREQREAVEALEGPVLVVAGPGTGKTQLLAARVENILAKTDADASNILCLTFTNDGARNMRERLRSLIGEASYKITVGTYHEFGGEILKNYPESFGERRYLTLIDDLKAYEIFNAIVEGMSYTNGLRYKEWRGVKGLVADMKRAGLSPADLREIAEANGKVIGKLERAANEIFPARMPGVLAQVRPLFEKWFRELGVLSTVGLAGLPSLGRSYLTDLEVAMAEAEATGKATPLNKYKAGIMERVGEEFRLKARKSNERLLALAEAYEQYRDLTEAEGLYDFDDIILAVNRALAADEELRAELQERYQYVLLDEYQDTNAAQGRMVELLLDNPIWEGRPNVLAVGDDDQAIYAFQGALQSNLADFYRRYRDVKLVNLSKNYRSVAGIVEFAASFRKTIRDGVFENKTLVVAGASPNPTPQTRCRPTLSSQDGRTSFSPVGCERSEVLGWGEATAAIERIDFKSEVGERNWVSGRILELVAAGVRADEIAVLARRHEELEGVAKHLQAAGVKVRYERQNDILTAPGAVREFLDFCELLVAARERSGREDELAARVFYAGYWGLAAGELYKVARTAREGWIGAMLASECPDIRRAATEVVELAGRLFGAPLTEVVAELAGRWQGDEAEIYALNSAILILLKAVSASKPSSLPPQTRCRPTLSSQDGRTSFSPVGCERSEEVGLQGLPSLKSLVEYVGGMRAAGLALRDGSPYRAAGEAVNLMTAHGAKGLEFEQVFIIGAHNTNWVRTGSQKGSTLPPNLQAIYSTEERDDDKRRLLYVAATRAKKVLYMTRARGDFSGQRSFEPIEYLDEREVEGRTLARALPEAYQAVREGEAAEERPKAAVLGEELGRLAESPDWEAICEEFRANYVLSASDVNLWIDSEYGGPGKFYRERVLRCPVAPSRAMAFGTLVHGALQAAGEAAKRGEAMDSEVLMRRFEADLAAMRDLTENERRLLAEQGEFVLPRWWAANGEKLAAKDAAVEKWFNYEKDGVRLRGKVDRIEGGGEGRTVVDFKTGKAGGAKSEKTYKAQLQLYIYKLLVESEPGGPVVGGRVEFVAADGDGRVSKALELEFGREEEELVWQLVGVIWRRIMAMDFGEALEAAETGAASFRQFLENKIKAFM